MFDFKFTGATNKEEDNSVLKSVGDAMSSARDTLMRRCDLNEEQAWDIVIELFRAYMKSNG